MFWFVFQVKSPRARRRLLFSATGTPPAPSRPAGFFVGLDAGLRRSPRKRLENTNFENETTGQ